MTPTPKICTNGGPHVWESFGGLDDAPGVFDRGPKVKAGVPIPGVIYAEGCHRCGSTRQKRYTGPRSKAAPINAWRYDLGPNGVEE